MKPPVLIALLVVLLGIGAYFYDTYSGPQMTPVEKSPAERTLSKNDPVPAFSFTDITGKAHDIRDLEGSVVLLNFWATYCAPCVRELPAMIALTESMNGKVKLLALSSDIDVQTIEKFFAKMKAKGGPDALSSPHTLIVWDESSKISLGLFLTRKFPETIVIAPDGAMTRKIVGEIDWTGEEIRAFLKALSK